MKVTTCLLLCLASLLTPARELHAAAPTPEQREWLTKASRHEKGGWIYLHIEGTAQERGFQHGYLLAPEITEALRVRKAVSWHNTAMEWKTLLQETARFILPFVEQENKDELAGIVEGLKAAGQESSLEELAAFNASIELEGYWWPEVRKKAMGGSTSVTPPVLRCSSFIATGSMTKDHGIVLGHNTMSDYVEANCNVVIDIKPARGHRILMQTVPGWIHSGTDFFITDAGLVGSETTIGGFQGFTEWGIPEFSRMRTATQYANTLDDWCTTMRKGNNGGYANAWLLGDINTGEIARLEQGLAYEGFERTKDGYFIGSNIAENRKLLIMETEANDTDIRENPVARRVRWKQLMKEYRGRIDMGQAKAFEGDHYDTYLKKTRLGDRTLCEHGEYQAESDLAWMIPFRPFGTIDAKVVDSTMAKRMSFAARWGSGCGAAFDAPKFLEEHPQFDWLEGLLQSRPSQDWVTFTAGE